MRYILLTLLFLRLLSAPVYAQRSTSLLERYNMSCLDLTIGLPHDHVNDIFVDSQGFVWVSSYGGGAVRYDGYSFKAPSQGDSRSCLCFAEDRHHRLWIAYDEGTVVIDLNTMRRVVPSFGKGNIGSLLQRASVKVYCDSKGALWQVARDSIYRYEFDHAGHVSNISRCRYQGNTPYITIRDIENNGNVWVSTSLGLSRLTAVGSTLKMTPIHTVLQTLKGLFVTDILRQGSHVWIATNQGLYDYHLYDNTLHTYRHTLDERSLSHDHATSLALTADGNLLVGTLRGICLFDASHSDFFRWNSSTASCPLPSDFVRCLLNYEGQLWIGTETAGIVRLLPKPLLLQNYVHQPNNPQSLSPNPVNAIYAADGALWVGNVEGGLCRMVKGESGGEHSDIFQHWTTANSSLSHNSVSVLEPDTHGRLWIATWGGGINYIPLKGNALPQPLVFPADYQRQTNYIGALAYDRYNDALWIGSNDGIFLYDLKTGKIEDPFPGNRNIRGCIGACVDHTGHLWIGSITGVCDINLRARRNGSYSFRYLRHKLDKPQSAVIDRITCICEAKDGTLWLGSDGYGLYHRIVDKGGKERFEVLTTDDGLANNSVKGVVDDDQGRLWVTTNNGLSLYDPSQHTFVNYGERDGLLCQRFYWNAAVKGVDGAIYLGSTKGLTEIRGENMDAVYPEHLTFTGLMVDNQEVTSFNSSILDADISHADKIQLHESNKSFALSFSALSYAGKTQHYIYRLRGFEEDWTALKPGEHTVRYTSLKPGTYVFEVKNSTEAGLEGQTISIEVVITPYFWKSWWFLLLCFIMLSVASVFFFKQRLMALRRQEAEKLLIPIKKVLEDSDAPEALQMRIQNILHHHERMKESRHRSVETDKQQTQPAKSFMERATDILEHHYMDSQFDITEFADAIGMSKSLLAKRIKEETGQSTTQFIRNYRLSVARDLILENYADRNITEIAYKVGFNDPKYFTRCFTSLYGTSPSTYKSTR